MDIRHQVTSFEVSQKLRLLDGQSVWYWADDPVQGRSLLNLMQACGTGWRNN
jgi:hypothetical protein